MYGHRNHVSNVHVLLTLDLVKAYVLEVLYFTNKINFIRFKG